MINRCNEDLNSCLARAQSFSQSVSEANRQAGSYSAGRIGSLLAPCRALGARWKAAAPSGQIYGPCKCARTARLAGSGRNDDDINSKSGLELLAGAQNHGSVRPDCPHAATTLLLLSLLLLRLRNFH